MLGGTPGFLAPEACHALSTQGLPLPLMEPSLDVYAFAGVILQVCTRRSFHTTEPRVSVVDSFIRPFSSGPIRVEISVSLDSHA